MPKRKQPQLDLSFARAATLMLPVYDRLRLSFAIIQFWKSRRAELPLQPYNFCVSRLANLVSCNPSIHLLVHDVALVFSETGGTT